MTMHSIHEAIDRAIDNVLWHATGETPDHAASTDDIGEIW